MTNTDVTIYLGEKSKVILSILAEVLSSTRPCTETIPTGHLYKF